MHSGITHFISITLDKNAHSPIAYNTIIVVINIFYKLEYMFQTLVIFSLYILSIVVVTVRADSKFLAPPS